MSHSEGSSCLPGKLPESCSYEILKQGRCSKDSCTFNISAVAWVDTGLMVQVIVNRSAAKTESIHVNQQEQCGSLARKREATVEEAEEEPQCATVGVSFGNVLDSNMDVLLHLHIKPKDTF
ncbi:hypothetical protein STEG23_026213 [Scotinomys teguina]